MIVGRMQSSPRRVTCLALGLDAWPLRGMLYCVNTTIEISSNEKKDLDGRWLF